MPFRALGIIRQARGTLESVHIELTIDSGYIANILRLQGTGGDGKRLIVHPALDIPEIYAMGSGLKVCNIHLNSQSASYTSNSSHSPAPCSHLRFPKSTL